jgi:hypothetical protein
LMEREGIGRSVLRRVVLVLAIFTHWMHLSVS